MDKEKIWAQINDLCSEIYEITSNEEVRSMIERTFALLETDADENVERLAIPFLRRVYARVDAGFELPPVNSIGRASLDGGEEFYMVKNYDYPTFKWAIKSGFDKWIDCRVLYIPKKRLSKEAAEAIEKKIKN